MPKDIFKFNRFSYTPEGAKQLTDRNLREEYSRLRSIAVKRLQRLGNSEWNDTDLYLRSKNKFKKLKDIKNERELRYLFSDLHYFLESPRSSVTGLDKIRRQSLDTLHAHGYEFVTKKNFREFARFMEWAREHAQAYMYDSDRVANAYNELAVKRNLSQQEIESAFRAWSRRERKLQKIRNMNPRTSQEIFDKYFGRRR